MYVENRPKEGDGNMSTERDKLTQLVENALEHIGEDEEILAEVRNSVNFKVLVREEIGKPGPLRDAVIKQIVNTVENLELGDENLDALVEALQVPDITEELMKSDAEFRKKVVGIVSRIVLDYIEDNDEFNDSIRESLGIDGDDIVKLLEKTEELEKIRQAIRAKVLSYVEDDLELTEEDLETVRDAIFNRRFIEDLLEKQDEEVSRIITKKLPGILEQIMSSDEGESGDKIREVIFESQAFKRALDEYLSSAKNMDELVEKLVKNLTEDDDSSFAQILKQKLSEKLADKIAGRLFMNLFPGG